MLNHLFNLIIMDQDRKRAEGTYVNDDFLLQTAITIS